MKQQQKIEMIQKHHPEMTATEIRIYLNKALDEFCEQTKLDYVYCSPYRVPIARLAAAHAYLKKKK